MGRGRDTASATSARTGADGPSPGGVADLIQAGLSPAVTPPLSPPVNGV